MTTPKVLLLTHRLKDYWASPHGRARIRTVITPETLSVSGPLVRSSPLAPFALALYAALLAPKYDAVVCMGRHQSLAFGMVRQLARLKTPAIGYQFILPDANDSRRKVGASQWDRLASHGLAKIIVNSAHEVSDYADRLQAHGRTVFVPIPVDPTVFEITSQPRVPPTLFSGGNTMRDYPTLFQSIEGLEARVKIVVGGPGNLESARLPANTEVLYQLPFRTFLQEMASGQIVIIPLHQTRRAAGQATIIYAQAMGCATIASDVPGVRDYISHGVNGWLVPPEDSVSLREAIQELLADSALRERLAANARTHALGTYTYEAYDRRIGGIISDVVQ